jgi:hypothetical protein
VIHGSALQLPSSFRLTGYPEVAEERHNHGIGWRESLLLLDTRSSGSQLLPPFPRSRFELDYLTADALPRERQGPSTLDRDARMRTSVLP